MASAIASRVSAVAVCAGRELAPSVKRTAAPSLAALLRPHAGQAALSSASRCASRAGLAAVAKFPSRSASAAAGRVVATISVGDKLPEATLSYFDKEGNVQSVTVSELTRGKKVVLFGVPGAFTPTCSSKHLPGFVAKADELRRAGVDTLACVSVNDAFVMQAWGKSAGVGENVLMLSDGLGKFTQALGTAVDLTDKVEGLGVRSRRFSMLVEDGVVKVLNLEEGGAFTSSGAEDILSSLQKASA